MLLASRIKILSAGSRASLQHEMLRAEVGDAVYQDVEVVVVVAIDGALDHAVAVCSGDAQFARSVGIAIDDGQTIIVGGVHIGVDMAQVDDHALGCAELLDHVLTRIGGRIERAIELEGFGAENATRWSLPRPPTAFSANQ